MLSSASSTTSQFTTSVALSTLEQVRVVVLRSFAEDGEGSPLGDDDDLYDAGMTSRGSVSLMMALEEALELTFPDDMLRRDVFHSVSSIARAVAQLRAQS